MCAYKPPMIKSGSGPTGVAKVVFSSDGKAVKVTFVDSEVYGKPIVLKRDKCPDNLRPGEWYIGLNANKDEIRSWRPVNGMFKAKVQKFTSAPDKPPVPQTHPQWEYQYFTVLFELIAPKDVRGCIVPNNYRYHLGQYVNEDGKEVVGYTHTKSKYTPQLADFLDTTGAWDRGEIAYKDNVLPILEKRILKADKVVNIVLKDGWVNTIFATDETVESSGTPKEEPDLEDEDGGGDFEDETSDGELPWDEE